MKKNKFRKLHIVGVKDNVGPIYLHEGAKKNQYLE
jgi:hypothetical protein